MQRTRTFTWSDPLETARAAVELPGIDAIRKIAEGELPPPPIAELLDFEITLVEDGRVVFAITPEEWMYNPIGSVHGGVAATLLDSSLGCAVATFCCEEESQPLASRAQPTSAAARVRVADGTDVSPF